MGLFSSESINEFPWQNLTSVEQFDALWNAENEQAILVFKHSTRCSISTFAKKNFEKEWSANNCAVFYLDLLAHRDVSNHIEKITKVFHQSPQAIVFQNKQIIYSDSHQGIDAKSIEKLL